MQAIEGADKPRVEIQISPWARDRRAKAQKLLQYVLDRVRKLPGSSGGAPILESERLAAVSIRRHSVTTPLRNSSAVSTRRSSLVVTIHLCASDPCGVFSTP